MQVVQTEGPETGEHAVRGRTRFAERRVAQLLVESGGKVRAEVDAAVPDGCDLAQIKLAFFIRERETLVASSTVISGETDCGRITTATNSDGRKL